jgi:hypothetical protein
MRRYTRTSAASSSVNGVGVGDGDGDAAAAAAAAATGIVEAPRTLTSLVAMARAAVPCPAS